MSLIFSRVAHTRLSMEQSLPLKWCPMFLLFEHLKALDYRQELAHTTSNHFIGVSKISFVVYFTFDYVHDSFGAARYR